MHPPYSHCWGRPRPNQTLTVDMDMSLSTSFNPFRWNRDGMNHSHSSAGQGSRHSTVHSLHIPKTPCLYQICSAGF